MTAEHVKTEKSILIANDLKQIHYEEITAMSKHKWKRHIMLSEFITECRIKIPKTFDAGNFVTRETVRSHPEFPNGFCKTCLKMWKNRKENRRDFWIGDRVTDGECTGIVTNIFQSFDILRNATRCLSVRLPKEQEDFKCNRADWWWRII